MIKIAPAALLNQFGCLREKRLDLFVYGGNIQLLRNVHGFLLSCTRNVSPLRVADTRVQGRIENVGNQVERDHKDRTKHQHREQDRVIARIQ